MSAPKRYLRALLLAEFALIMIAVTLSFLTEPWLPEPLRAFNETQSMAPLTTKRVALLGIGGFLFAVNLIAWIGLFFFWPPARFLFLLGNILGLFAMAFVGPYVETGVVRAIDDASVLATGIILAVIYFSPAKELFERNAATQS